jgi:hypothetical protein
MADRVRLPFSYYVEPTREGVRLTAHREIINFAREVIPDGQMAGMMGHREVPGEEEVSFDLHVTEARALLDQLQQALDSRPLSSDD